VTAAPHQCWACHRTAQLGTPAEATAVEPHLCPRCDHSYAVSLAGGPADFRGVDSPAFEEREAPAPSPAFEEREAPAPSPDPERLPLPDDARFDVEVVDVALPWELGYEPDPAALGLGVLLALAAHLALALYGARARVMTEDGASWQAYLADAESGALLTGHPSPVATSPERAAARLVEYLEDRRAHATGEVMSLAEAFPPLAPPRRAILPAAVTLTADDVLVDAATREVLLPGLCDEASAEPELRRAEAA